MNLNDGEELVENLNLHFGDTVLAFLLLALAIVLYLGSSRAFSALVLGTGASALLFSGYFLAFDWSKQYLVTNQRVCIIEGVLFKRQVDIPLETIQDVVVFRDDQSSPPLFPSGKLHIVTAQNRTYEINCISDPEGAGKKIRSRALGRLLFN